MCEKLGVVLFRRRQLRQAAVNAEMQRSAVVKRIEKRACRPSNDFRRPFNGQCALVVGSKALQSFFHIMLQYASMFGAIGSQQDRLKMTFRATCAPNRFGGGEPQLRTARK